MRDAVLIFKKLELGHGHIAEAVGTPLSACSGSSRAMVLTVGETEREFISNYLLKKGITRNNVIIGFQIGAADQYKVWPPEIFALLVKRLLPYGPGVRIIITGSPEEKLCSSVATTMG
jgi:ADP-heptose:LPS heptosyltransferase